MKAAVFQGYDRGHRIERIADPAPGRHDVVIRVERSGICSSDLAITSRHDPSSPLAAMFEPMSRPGTVLGHEAAGEVVALGAAVETLAVGDRVVPSAFSGCGTCGTCLAGKPDWCAGAYAKMGGYAEYCLADERFCVRAPAALSIDEAALVEPMATSLHAVTLAGLVASNRVVVVGAGPIGLGITQFVRRSGVRRVVTVARSHRHRELALAMGADAFVTQGPTIETELLDRLGGRPDVVFDASAAPGITDQAIGWLRPAGKLVAVGISSVPDPVLHSIGVMKEICLQYSASYLREDFLTLVDLFAAGHLPLRGLISRTVRFGEFASTFESLRAANAECKVLLDPTVA